MTLRHESDCYNMSCGIRMVDDATTFPCPWGLITSFDNASLHQVLRGKFGVRVPRRLLFRIQLFSGGICSNSSTDIFIVQWKYFTIDDSSILNRLYGTNIFSCLPHLCHECGGSKGHRSEYNGKLVG
jgi:hypothetical protein